jgi:hypothetical protein
MEGADQLPIDSSGRNVRIGTRGKKGVSQLRIDTTRRMRHVHQLRINTVKVDKMYESAAYRQNQRAKKVCMSCV